MAKLNDAARAEIAAAVKILREDGIHIHRTYAQFQESLKTTPKPEDGDPEPKEGDAPPEKERPEPPAPRKSAWWG